EFNCEQYSPTGELAQLVWEGQTLVYRTRAANAWFEEPIAVSSDFTQAQYSTRNQVQSAAESAQLVFTGDGTPHVLFLQESWNSQANAFQTLVQHYERIGGQWEHVETISAPWLSTWGPSNLVAEPGAGNTLHILFSETYTAATGVGNFGTGILWYGTNTSGSWQFAKVADTADPRVDVWFSGGDWAPRFISMAIDANNNAYVTYTPEFYIAGAFSTVYSQLNFATNRGGSWQTSTIYAPQDGTADAGLGASIAINPTNGQVSVASYYVDRYNTGSPQTSKLMYHTLNANGTWTNSDVVTAPDDYSAADGPHFTGFTPQLFFSASGQANIVFSDEASQHLPVTFANEYAGQIRMATFNGGKWSMQTVYRQNDPIHNQLFYPIAATYKGQTTFGGLQAVSRLARFLDHPLWPDIHRRRPRGPRRRQRRRRPRHHRRLRRRHPGPRPHLGRRHAPVDLRRDAVREFHRRRGPGDRRPERRRQGGCDYRPGCRRRPARASLGRRHAPEADARLLRATVPDLPGRVAARL